MLLHYRRDFRNGNAGISKNLHGHIMEASKTRTFNETTIYQNVIHIHDLLRFALICPSIPKEVGRKHHYKHFNISSVVNGRKSQTS